MDLQGILRKRSTLVIRVAIGHLAALALMFAILQTGSCQPEKTELTKVRLVSLSQPQSSRNRSTAHKDTLQRTPKRTEAETVYRTPEQIRQSGFIKTKIRSDSKSPSSRKKHTFAALKDRLAEPSTLIDGGNVGESVSESETSYVEIITKHIYQLWDQPSQTEIHGNLRPTVKIRLRIENDGSITIKRITAESKSAAMNNSVVRLLNDLKRFPPFPAKLDKRSIDKSVILELS